MTTGTTPFLPTRAVLRTIVPMSDGNHLFRFSIPDGEQLSACLPGQFVQLWIPGVGECPISVCSDFIPGFIELCVRRVGRVTDALFRLCEGDWVGLRGPYGHGFPVAAYEGKNVCLIAGGLGIAPIRSVLQFILNRREKFGDLTLIYGMRHSLDLLFRQELEDLYTRSDIHIYIGAEEIDSPDVPPIHAQLGRVTDIIRMAPLSADCEVALCGPPVMYPYVIKELKEKGICESHIWMSLERHMKCGIGKCGHCFAGGVYMCKTGPVLSLSDARYIPEVVECGSCV